MDKKKLAKFISKLNARHNLEIQKGAGVQEAVSRLIQEMHDQYYMKPNDVTAALIKIGETDSLPLLHAEAENQLSDNSGRSGHVLYILTVSGLIFGSEKSLPLMEKIYFSGKMDEFKTNMLMRIREMSWNGNVPDELISIYLQETDPNIKKRARDHILSIGIRAVPFLEEKIKGLEGESAGKIRKILDEIIHLEALEKKVSMGHFSSDDARVELLFEYLCDSNETYRKSARERIAEIGAPALPYAIKAAKSPDIDARIEAMQIFREWKMPEFLRAGLEDPYYGVRTIAAHGLELLGGPQDIPMLSKLCLDRNEHEYVVSAAAGAIIEILDRHEGEIPAKKTAEMLYSLLRGASFGLEHAKTRLGDFGGASLCLLALKISKEPPSPERSSLLKTLKDVTNAANARLRHKKATFSVPGLAQIPKGLLEDAMTAGRRAFLPRANPLIQIQKEARFIKAHA